jgi:gluconokinase
MLVVMGVSGSGKSTIAAQLAGKIGAVYVDADDLHPPENVAKMHSGTPLTDDDRWPWLDKVASVLVGTTEARGGAVMACSALRRIYRDRLRDGTARRVHFVFLDADFATIQDRLARRIHHFMPESLLRSQFATLERPGDDEPDVLTVAADQAPEVVIGHIMTRLGAIGLDAPFS